METFESVITIGFAVWIAYMFLSSFAWAKKVKDAGRWESVSAANLIEWRLRNPGVYIGLSPQGKDLVVDRIKSYENYLVVLNIKSYECDAYLEFLKSLLNEFPDPSPNEFPSEQQSRKGLLFV